MRENSKIIYRDSNSKQLTYLAIGASLVTLIFAREVNDPFNTPKLVTLLIIASLSAIKLSTLFRLEYIKKDSVTLLLISILAIFLTSGAMAVLFSDNLTVALVGDTQRRNGYLSYFALVLIALTTSQLVSFRNIRNLFSIAILTGFVFSIYGVIQMSGRDVFDWNNPYNSVISTVGNPNFASALMAIFSVISVISLFDKEQNLIIKFFAVACTILSLVAIIASNSRQGLVSMSFALLFFVCAYVYSIRKKLGLFAIFFSTLISSMAIAGMLQIGPLARFLYKPSVTVRGYYWDAALQMLKDHPATGVGFDHYLYYFKEVRDVGYPLKYGFSLTSSNAHNTFLQMFANGGVFLGLIYMILVLFTLYTGIKVIKNSSGAKNVVAICLLSSWIAFQAQSVISIDNIGISIWGWILTGAVFGLARDLYFSGTTTYSQVQKNKNHMQASLKPIILAPILLVPALIISVSLMGLESDTYKAKILFDNYVYQAKGNKALSQQLKTELNKRIESVLNQSFSDPNYQLQMAYYLFDSGDQKKGIEVANMVADKFPRNLYALESLSIMYKILNAPKDAIYWREKVAKSDPWNAENYLELLRLYKSLGDIQNEQKMYDTIISFAPSSNEAKSALEELSK